MPIVSATPSSRPSRLVATAHPTSSPSAPGRARAESTDRGDHGTNAATTARIRAVTARMQPRHLRCRGRIRTFMPRSSLGQEPLGCERAGSAAGAAGLPGAFGFDARRIVDAQRAHLGPADEDDRCDDETDPGAEVRVDSPGQSRLVAVMPARPAHTRVVPEIAGRAPMKVWLSNASAVWLLSLVS